MYDKFVNAYDDLIKVLNINISTKAYRPELPVTLQESFANVTTLDNYQGPNMCFCFGPNTEDHLILRRDASGGFYFSKGAEIDGRYSFTDCPKTLKKEDMKKESYEPLQDMVDIDQETAETIFIQFLSNKLLCPTSDGNVNLEDIDLESMSLVSLDEACAAQFDKIFAPHLPWKSTYVRKDFIQDL